MATALECIMRNDLSQSHDDDGGVVGASFPVESLSSMATSWAAWDMAAYNHVYVLLTGTESHK